MITEGSPRSRTLAAAVLGSAFLAACGGTSGSVSGSTVTGVAVTDAPLSGASVTLVDASPNAKQRAVTTRADGSFSVDVSGLTPPYAVRVQGDSKKLYALTEGNENLDVTPITDLAFDYAAGRQGKDAYFSSATAAQKKAGAVSARAILTDVAAQAAPLLNRYGIKNLRTDNVGVRRLLQDVSVASAGGVVTFKNRRTNGSIQTFCMGGDFDPSQIPSDWMSGGGWDPNNLPSEFSGRFDPGQLPAFDPSLIPSGFGGFDPGQFGDWSSGGFDPNLIPSGFADFDPSQIPSDFGGGCFDASLIPSDWGHFDPSQFPGGAGGGFGGGQLTTATKVVAELYTSACANCHGGMTTSSRRNTTAAQIMGKHGTLVSSAKTATALAAGLSDRASCGSPAWGGSSGGGWPSPGGNTSGGTRPTPGGNTSGGGWPTPGGSASGGSWPTPGGNTTPGGSASGGSWPTPGGNATPGGNTTPGGNPGPGRTDPSNNLPAGHPATNGKACSDCH
jgi:hypothetical protein